MTKRAFQFLKVRRFPIGWSLAIMFLFAQGSGWALPSTTVGGSGQGSTVTATGVLVGIDQNGTRLILDPDKPFWAPGPEGNARITLWPTQVKFSVVVSFGTAVTIDGKKASLNQLAIGQNATIQYGFALSSIGPYAHHLHCVGRRVDARTASSPKTKEKH